MNVVEKYLATYDDSKLDRYFSIQRTGVNHYMMGDKSVLVDNEAELLLAEFAAWNTPPTWNDIVYILDELLRQKQISRAEYRDINS